MSRKRIEHVQTPIPMQFPMPMRVAIIPIVNAFPPIPGPFGAPTVISIGHTYPMFGCRYICHPYFGCGWVCE